jgi:hypothetical protein
MYATCSRGSLQQPVTQVPCVLNKQCCTSAKRKAIRTLNQLPVIGGITVIIIIIIIIIIAPIIITILVGATGTSQNDLENS